jgi:8-amino-7-oxononanoate synthase
MVTDGQTHPFEAVLSERLDAQARAGLLRARRRVTARHGTHVEIDGRVIVSFCSNDYLGFADDAVTRRGALAAVQQWGAGAGASRLISGDLDVVRRLERELADWEGVEDVLVFASGYMANLGVITALVGPDDLIVLDRLAHASLIDGARRSGATLRVFAHNDVAALDALLRRRDHVRTLVVTESVFSMDGDCAPLPELCACCERHDAWLMVDEAHALGVYGDGRGCLAGAGLTRQAAVVTGTLSKALGSQGGFVAGRKVLVEWLVNRARPFIYSTGITPAAAGAARETLQALRRDNSRIERLWCNVRLLRAELAGLPLRGHGPICPVIAGSSPRALALARALDEQGWLVPAIRPPTVPRGSARLRVTVSARHTENEIVEFAQALRQAWDSLKQFE